MSTLKKLAGETATYGVSTMLGRLLNYLLVILHSQFFLPAQLASQVQMYAWVGLLFVVYTFGMETAFFRFAKRESDREQYFNLIQSAVLTVSFVLSGLGIFFSDVIAVSLGYPDEGILVKWFSVIMLTDAASAIPFALLRLEKKGKKFVRVKITNILVNIGLNLFFLIICRDIYEGHYGEGLKPLVDWFYPVSHPAQLIVLANLLANLLFLIMLRQELFRFRFVWNKTLFRPVWVYAFPIFIMNLAGVTNMLFDRAFLNFLLPGGFYPNRTTQDAVGIYGQAYKLSIFMNLAIQAFKYAAEPFFFTKSEDRDAPEVFAQVMKWFVILCTVMWVGISVNLDLLAELFLRKKIYHEGLGVVPFLLIGFLFLGIYYNLATWFKVTDKTQYGTYFTFTGMAVTILLNLVLVPKIGYLGCGIAFAVSGFSMTALSYYFGQKYYPVPYDVPSAIKHLTLATLLIIGVRWLPLSGFWLTTATHVLISVVYLLVVIYTERSSLPKRLRGMLRI